MNVNLNLDEQKAHIQDITSISTKIYVSLSWSLFHVPHSLLWFSESTCTEFSVPYNTWMNILSCNTGIRRKYNGEQDRLEHLKMSQKYFYQQAEILTLNLFAKKSQFYLQSTWGQPSKSSCLIRNLHKKSSPSNWALAVFCSNWAFAAFQLLNWATAHFRNHQNPWKAYLVQKPFRTQKQTTYLNEAAYIKKSLCFCALRSTDFCNHICNMSSVIKQQQFSGMKDKTVYLIFKLQ